MSKKTYTAPIVSSFEERGIYEYYLVGNLWPLGGFRCLGKEKEDCGEYNEQGDNDSLEVGHGEEHQLCFVIQSFQL